MRCHCFVAIIATIAPTTSCFSIASSSTATRQPNGYSQSIGHHRRQPSLHDDNDVGSNNPFTITRTQHHHYLTSTSLQSSSILSALPAVRIPATDIVRTVIGIILARRISNSGLKKKSLNQSGALSAFIVASLSLATSWRNGITLLAFYWTSSKLTRVGSKIKGKLEEGATEGGERGAMQVFACSLIGVICACIRRLLVGSDGPLRLGGSSVTTAILGDQLTLAYVAFFACCAGDTWASELGVLSKSLPRLIIKPWKKVPPGTNGGISVVGLGASAAGGMLMGLLHGVFVPGGIASLMLPFNNYWPSSALSAIPPAQFGREVLVLTFVGFMGGFGGSLLDSLLGATVQATYYDDETKKIAKRSGPTTTKVGGWGFLSNEMVNVVSTAMSALVTALVARPLLNWI
mmetsp:Transcript_20118/g.36171  ORF Transcript_20118/g.36171 Transcript_20118/m.36171 type:complete len:404 (-) Transcript_20118:87-1298(-)